MLDVVDRDFQSYSFGSKVVINIQLHIYIIILVCL